VILAPTRLLDAFLLLVQQAQVQQQDQTEEAVVALKRLLATALPTRRLLALLASRVVLVTNLRVLQARLHLLLVNQIVKLAMQVHTIPILDKDRAFRVLQVNI